MHGLKLAGREGRIGGQTDLHVPRLDSENNSKSVRERSSRRLRVHGLKLAGRGGRIGERPDLVNDRNQIQQVSGVTTHFTRQTATRIDPQLSHAKAL